MDSAPLVTALSVELDAARAALARASSREATLLGTVASLRDAAAASAANAHLAATVSESTASTSASQLAATSESLTALVAENDALSTLVSDLQGRLAASNERVAALSAGVTGRNDMLYASEQHAAALDASFDEVRELACTLAEELDAERTRSSAATSAAVAACNREAVLAARLSSAVAAAASAASGASAATRECVELRASIEAQSCELIDLKKMLADERAAATAADANAARALSEAHERARVAEERCATIALSTHVPVSSSARGALGATATARGLRLFSPTREPGSSLDHAWAAAASSLPVVSAPPAPATSTWGSDSCRLQSTHGSAWGGGVATAITRETPQSLASFAASSSAFASHVNGDTRMTMANRLAATRAELSSQQPEVPRTSNSNRAPLTRRDLFSGKDGSSLLLERLAVTGIAAANDSLDDAVLSPSSTMPTVEQLRSDLVRLRASLTATSMAAGATSGVGRDL